MATVPQFAHWRYRKYRIATFATALPLGMAIISNARLIYGHEEYEKRLSLGNLELMAAFHTIGAIFYVTRVSTSLNCHAIGPLGPFSVFP